MIRVGPEQEPANKEEEREDTLEDET
jgi:hypothetical protein